MARTEAAYSTASQAPALQRVWQSMRIHRRFTAPDLMTTAEAGETAVHKYLKALHAAGYLRLAQPRVSGRPGSFDLWALVRDSGPLAPIRRRDGSGVFDPNTQQVWSLQGQLVQDAPPPPPPRLAQAGREALRHLHELGRCKASGETLQTLLRAGLVSLAITDAGRALLAACPAPKTQREGAAHEA